MKKLQIAPRPKSSFQSSKNKSLQSNEDFIVGNKQYNHIPPKSTSKIKFLKQEIHNHSTTKYQPNSQSKKSYKQHNHNIFDKKNKVKFQVNGKISKQQREDKSIQKLKLALKQIKYQSSMKKQKILKNGISKSFNKQSNDRLLSQSKQKQKNKNNNQLYKPKRSNSVKICQKTNQNSDVTNVNINGLSNILLKLQTSFRSKQGKLITNPSKPNQDSVLVLNNFLNKNNKQIHLYAVADGHGTDGHLVSQKIVQNLPAILKRQLQLTNTTYKALSKCYNEIQNILSLKNHEINVFSSGSTLVTVLIEGTQLICANTGDSRAILARQDKKCWEVIYLSQDHKPSVPKQKARILKKGGRVFPFHDEYGKPVGPMRVWLPNNNYQGLAMSRSLGDNISKPIGVTHEPELTKVNIQSKDRFILIGSDGVWQFITNQQVLQLISPYYRENKIEEASDALLKLAYQRWTTEDTTVVDDISFVLIFLGK